MTKDDALRMMLGPFKAWRDVPGNEDVVEELTKIINAVEKALAQPEQEPVAWADHGVVNWIADKQFKHASLLYTTPPQRTWVSLSDEDRNDCLVEADPCECLAEPEAQELMRCVEAKSRSKNQ